MPTESAFFFAGLLFLAAALGYVFARLGQLDDEDRGPSGLDYVRGLKFLLKEQPDRALEALTGAAELDEDTIETHFALGQLFRRRGEVERAIRVHRDLIERPNLKRDAREQAQFELAQDYLSAGLFDRAEALLTEIRDSPKIGLEALRKLIRLSELTREWERAIDLHRELEKRDRAAGISGTVSHYFCELAEQARQGGDLGRASAWLDRAALGRPESVRVLLSRAAVAADGGDESTALGCFRRVAEREPSLLVEVLPRLSAFCRASDCENRFAEFLHELLEHDSQAGRAVAFATMLDPAITDKRALECLWEFVSTDATLQALVGGDRLRGPLDDERREVLVRVRGALRAMAINGRTYRCLECGYTSASMQWQCPGCAAWDTVRPRIRLAFESGDR
jgi:lipopolysaccharide biosynthesis regulator YciM